MANFVLTFILYRDMAFFKYSVQEILAVAGEDDPKMKEKREEVRSQMEKKFGYYERRSDDLTFEGRFQIYEICYLLTIRK